MTSGTKRVRKHGSSGKSSTQRLAVTSAHKKERKNQRLNANASTNIMVGAVIGVVGLAFAVGMALNGAGPGTGHSVALLIAPWLLVVIGIAVAVYGFMHLPSGRQRE